jgi:hypothetical protein
MLGMDDLRDRRPDLNPASVMFGRDGKSGLFIVKNADDGEHRPARHTIANKICMIKGFIYI